ncbi:MAG TPA: hypothetical protein VN598_06210 [Usitatibacter sp.]|nr:hypothetical protein [Usitatibacter sp.]
MPTGNIRWQSLIQNAPDETAVLGLVRRYLGTLTDGEVSRLPAGCRPTLPSTREEIASWAVTVARAEMGFRGDAETAALLQQLAVVFSEASQRFALLAQQRRALE